MYMRLNKAWQHCPSSQIDNSGAIISKLHCILFRSSEKNLFSLDSNCLNHRIALIHCIYFSPFENNICSVRIKLSYMPILFPYLNLSEKSMHFIQHLHLLLRCVLQVRSNLEIATALAHNTVLKR